MVSITEIPNVFIKTSFVSAILKSYHLRFYLTRDTRDRKIRKKRHQRIRKLVETCLKQKSHQRNKYFGRSPCKILSALLKMHEGVTPTDVPKNKEIDGVTEGLCKYLYEGG